MATTIEKVLSINGFKVMATWQADKIKELWASEQQALQNQLYPAVGMMYLFHEDNVQAISQYGIEGKTYVFGDSSTENGAIPAKALYYIETDGERSIQVFVTTEDGDYIPTEPNDQGEMFTAEYHDYITYLA